MKRSEETTLGGDAPGGVPDASGMTMALIVSRFNDRVTERLLTGARACLERHGATPADQRVVRVPGAWELQLAAHRLATGGGLDGIIALGALIRGETVHFDVLAHQVARGLGRVGLDTGIPVAFGVLTTDTLEQALARATEGPQNKGWEAALAAIEMVQFCRRPG